MSKKKREHVTFDRLPEKRKTLPFGKLNKALPRGKEEKSKSADEAAFGIK